VTAPPLRVLLIEDDPAEAIRICRSLDPLHGEPAATGGIETEVADRLDTGLQLLARRRFDVVLLDLTLPDGQGLQAFARLYAQAPDLPIIVIASRDDELLALKAIQHGAQDYIVKDHVHGGLVARAARHAVQRRSAEEALAAEQERLAVTLRSIGEGVITTDTAGRVTLLNRVAEELTGWTQDDAGGSPLVEVFRIFDETSLEPRDNPAAAVLGTGAVVAFQEVILRGRSGDERLVDGSCAPIRDREGAVIGSVLVFRDVTARRQLLEERLRASKLQAIGSLAGGIAHDFNNLLTTIIGHISLARTQVGGEDPVQELLAAAETASLRARDLTRQLLTFAEGGAPVMKTASLRELVEDTTRFGLRGSNIRAEIAIPPDLWPVEIDEGQFGQVVHHIVLNAKQSMPDGGTLRVTCDNTLVEDDAAEGLPIRPGRYVRIAFRDHGHGIAPEILPRIFDPYFTTRDSASGLGLAICYSIIQKHGGRITAHSEPGTGATFEILLPASDAAPPPAAPHATLPADRAIRVLVMDDDAMIRTVVSRMLEKIGCEVEVAADGNEAIQRCRLAAEAGRPFDAVIMDLTIPGGMGGREAVHHLRELDPRMKAIVSSGYSNDPIMARYREYGFDGVIAKPYRFDDLRATLQRVLAGAGA
jgi:PAS domain S-box-containing protein